MKKIDENYFKNTSNSKKQATETKDILNKDEQVLWQGKPNKKAYILSSIFSMFPFGLVWLLFDGGAIIALVASGALKQMPIGMIFGLIAFFAFHLFPVWIWLGHIITASRSYKNIEYTFTNKRIIVRSGIIGIDFKNIYYSEIQSVNLKVGIFDKLFKVGDIYIKSPDKAEVLFDISDPYFITQKLQEIVIDIKTDIEFPNGLRPEENPGYNTKYTKYQEAIKTKETEENKK